MTKLESRAIENIASAPATANDRRWAALCGVAIAAFFLLSIPWAGMRLPQSSAFVPTVSGTGAVALALTAVLLYSQYRIERDLKLALLAIAYGYAAATQFLYVLTFPQIFGAGLGFGAGPQSAAWAYVASQVGFAALLIAEGLAARGRLRASRNRVRALTAAMALVVLAIALLITLGHDLLPPLTEGNQYLPLWRGVVAPLMAVEMIVALAIVSHQLRSVTEVWLGVVLLARSVAIVSAGELATTRFSTGWYAARIEELISSVILLAVFLVKIDELMRRLAARNRSTVEALAVGEARYASLANVIPQLIWTANAQGEIEYVNDRWVQYTGLDLNGSRDGGWWRAVDPDDESQLRERWQRSIHTGEPLAGEFRLRERRGSRRRWFLVNAVPVRDQMSRIVAWIASSTDVDAQKRLEERETFLARAGERLSASLDVVETVAAIASLLQERLAQQVRVALLDDDGHFVVDGTPLGPGLRELVEEIVQAGEPRAFGEPERSSDPRVRTLPAGSVMIAPLISGDVPIGALMMIRTEGRAYDAGDVALVREFARRAALSLEHARLYERERSTADALQRAMLPSQLPVLSDVRFSASYSAASESQRVGGDFYDAFELPDGRVAITIGDVTGHGLEAAVIMGEIRQALRAAAFESAEPSAILDRASRLLVASGRSVFVTAIFGILDPVTGRFAYASAGHPPPLIDDGNELRRLTTAGLPIGLRDDQGVDFAIRLKAPCTLVAFTDGLMEFARDLDEGERRIETAIRTLARDDIDHLATALMKEVLRDDEPTDDIAILTVTIDRFAAAPPGEEREWRFSSEDERTGALVRHEVGALIARWTERRELRFAGELAFGELLANAVRYAPGQVRASLSSDDKGNVTLVVEDRGHGFTPRQRDVDPFAESGRGLTLVRGVADGMRVQRRRAGGTRVIVSFRAREEALPTSA